MPTNLPPPPQRRNANVSLDAWTLRRVRLDAPIPHGQPHPTSDPVAAVLCCHARLPPPLPTRRHLLLHPRYSRPNGNTHDTFCPRVSALCYRRMPTHSTIRNRRCRSSSRSPALHLDFTRW